MTSAGPDPAPEPPARKSITQPLAADVPERAVYPFGLSYADFRRLVLGLVFLAFAIWFLWTVQGILPPFLIAFFLSALFDPLLRREERRGRSRTVTTLLLYGGSIAIIALAGWLIVPPLVAQIEGLTLHFNTYYANIQTGVDGFLAHNLSWLQRFGIQSASLTTLIHERSGTIQKSLMVLLGGIAGIVTGIASKAIWFIIIPVAGFFIMRDFPAMRARGIALFPDKYQARIDEVSLEVVEVFSAYLRGLARICSVYAVVAGVALWLAGVPYALFLGVLAGLFYAVPYVGQFVTATVSGSVAFSMGGNPLMIHHVAPSTVGYALGIVITVVVLNNVFDQVVYPRIVGGSVGLHPVVSIFALACGATLMGIWGMLLAVPIAASIQIVLVYSFPRLKAPLPPALDAAAASELREPAPAVSAAPGPADPTA